jgi:hypothetical protein
LSTEALNNLQPFTQSHQFWVSAILVRLGDAKIVECVFDRESIYGFSKDEADKLIHNYLDVMEQSIFSKKESNDLLNDIYVLRLARTMPEVLSRLCCISSIELKYELLMFLNRLYSSTEKLVFNSVENLMKRLLDSMSLVEQYTLIPKLLEIPFPEKLNHHKNDEYKNPFSVLGISKKPANSSNIEVSKYKIDQLFVMLDSDNTENHRWASASVVKLYDLGLLD